MPSPPSSRRSSGAVRCYENIQRFLQFQLTINLSALTIAFLGPFFGVKPPFTVLQLLWINVIMDTFAAIALCSEPPREGVMQQPPRAQGRKHPDPADVGNHVHNGGLFCDRHDDSADRHGVGPLVRGDWRSSDELAALTTRQVTIFFSLYVFFQVWNEINCRSLTPRESGLIGLGGNPIFLAIVGVVAVVQILIVSLPGLGEVFKVAPLSFMDWLGIIAGSAAGAGLLRGGAFRSTSSGNGLRKGGSRGGPQEQLQAAAGKTGHRFVSAARLPLYRTILLHFAGGPGSLGGAEESHKRERFRQDLSAFQGGLSADLLSWPDAGGLSGRDLVSRHDGGSDSAFRARTSRLKAGR